MTNLRADQTVAREVAAAYLDAANRRDAVTVAAFAQVSQHGEHLFEAFCEFVSLHRLGCVRPSGLAAQRSAGSPSLPHRRTRRH
jgi:hypothetical protein